MKTEGKDVNPDQVTPHVVHPAIHQDYDIAPTLTSPMLSGLVSSVHLIGRPEVAKGPASPKTEEGLWGRGRAPAGPDVPGLSHIGGPVDTEGNKLLEQGGIHLDATIPVFNPEDAAAIIISDDDETSFPADWPEAVSTPKIELVWGQKQPSEDRSPRSSPPKKRATEEKEESPPPHEAVLPRGVSEERYEIFTSDYNWVWSVRGSLLGLEAGASPSRRDIDNSRRFVP